VIGEVNGLKVVVVGAETRSRLIESLSVGRRLDGSVMRGLGIALTIEPPSAIDNIETPRSMQ